jgi:hypothetical protein
MAKHAGFDPSPVCAYQGLPAEVVQCFCAGDAQAALTDEAQRKQVASMLQFQDGCIAVLQR